MREKDTRTTPTKKNRTSLQVTAEENELELEPETQAAPESALVIVGEPASVENDTELATEPVCGTLLTDQGSSDIATVSRLPT